MRAQYLDGFQGSGRGDEPLAATGTVPDPPPTGLQLRTLKRTKAL